MKKIIFLLIFIFINLNFVQAQQWEAIKGIEDVGLKAIAVDRENFDVIYVGSRFIYKTKDSGENWQKVWTLPAMAEVNFLLAEGKTVYAASEKGLFKSNDGGEKWQRIFKGIDEENNVLCLDGGGQNSLFYIGTQRGLFRSTDSENWQKSRGKLGNAEIYRVKTDPENANMIYVVSNEGFFKTDNRGKNWERTFVVSKIAEGEEQEEAEQQVDRLNDLAIAQGVIYLTGRDILLKSEDKGETWQEMSKGVLEGADIRSIVVFGNRIFLGTDRGVFKMHAARYTPHATRLKSEEQKDKEEIGQDWEEIYSGLPSLDIKKIVLAGDDLWAITGKGLFKTSATRFTLHATRQKSEKQREEKENTKEIEISIEQRIFELFVQEPTIREVQERAIEYAEVHPGKIKNWRRLSAKKAILPKFTAGANRNVSDLYHWEGGSTKTVDDDFLRKGREAVEWDVSFTWDLGDLIWTDSQTSIDVRSRLMVQLREDILDEITRTYFERKRLKIELFLSSPQDKEKKIEKELRLEELTASLDGLTGGWFSENITDVTD